MNRCIVAIMELVAIIRAGELVAKRAEAIRLASEILGCLADFLDGGPPAVGSAMPNSCPDTIEGCADKLEELLAAEPDSAERVGMNPLVFVVVKQLLKLLIEKIL